MARMKLCPYCKNKHWSRKAFNVCKQKHEKVYWEEPKKRKKRKR